VPIFPAADSANQRLPSGPVVIPAGATEGLSANSVMVPTGRRVPAGIVALPGNGCAEPGVVTVAFGGTVMSTAVVTAAVAIRPILLAFVSVNQIALSGPRVIPCTPLDAVGIVYSVGTPAVVTKPILLTPGSVNQRPLPGTDAISDAMPAG